jgi:hypothetical protein
MLEEPPPTPAAARERLGPGELATEARPERRQRGCTAATVPARELGQERGLGGALGAGTATAGHRALLHTKAEGTIPEGAAGAAD